MRARCPSRGTSGSSPRFYPKSWRLTMDEFLFYKVGRRRSRTESLHDLLVVAKNELKRTKIMHEANLSWRSMTELLKFAEDAGLIEEVAVLQYER